MANFVQKPNTGSFFLNAEKKSETHADYNGTINVEGKEYWINAWQKQTKTGATYYTFSVKAKEKPAEAKKMVEKAKAPQPDFVDDQDIPF
jgi:hypothetical protein